MLVQFGGSEYGFHLPLIASKRHFINYCFHMPPCDPLRSTTGTVIKIDSIVMKPLSSITTFRLLALMLVSMPLFAGCWIGEEGQSKDRPSGDQRPRSGNPAGPQATSASGGAAGVATKKIQNIKIQNTPGIQFGQTSFKLATKNNLVNQYIPVGQTLDNWQEMFVIRRFSDLNSPQEAINNVRENLIQDGADQNLISVSAGKQPDSELAIDFIIWTDDKLLTEFNVHVYRKVEGGMIANMYLMRGYGTEGHDSLSLNIATNRQLILDSVLGSQFPLFIQ